mgnify:CR=1 FL=1|tara:strand:+ start:2306 stop:2503 length:198 start_codon:yes stop_codon:yes gene_type:complete
MDFPKEIETVIWDDVEKSWKTEKVRVQEYHGFTECRYCRKPMSHNIKSNGEFKVVYVKCACNRTH